MNIAEGKVEKRIGDYVRGTPESVPILNAAYIADNYKRHVTQKFTAITTDQLLAIKEGRSTWHLGEEVFASIKVDGELQIFYYDKREEDGKSFFCSHGTHRAMMGLPVIKDLEYMLETWGDDVIILAGELFATAKTPLDFEERTKVPELIHYERAPENPDDLERIGFRAFDVIQIGTEDWLKQPYADRYAKLETTFPDKGRLARVVTQRLRETELYDFYEEVVHAGHEGIVIRNSDTFKAYKVKPIHSFDAVIIGAVEGIEDSKVGLGMLASALVALRYPDGNYVILTKVGGGLTDQQRVDLWNRMRFVNQPQFVAATEDGRAFRMVVPEVVVQLDYLDIYTETIEGLEIRQNALSYNEDTATWDILRSVPFVSLRFPRFSEANPIRDDKPPSPDNVRVTQVTDIVEVAAADAVSKMILLPSEVLARYVFAKGVDMVRKFMAWHTNKRDQNPNFPNFVAYTMDYSAHRAEPLKRALTITDNADQLWDIFDREVKSSMLGKGGTLTRGWTSYNEPVDIRGAPLDLGEQSTRDAKRATKKARKKATKKPAKKRMKKL